MFWSSRTAARQPRPEAGAQRTLEGVGWTRWLGVSAAAPPHMWKEQANPCVSFLLSSWEDRGSS